MFRLKMILFILKMRHVYTEDEHVYTETLTLRLLNSEQERRRTARLARQEEAERRAALDEMEPHVLKVLKRKKKRNDAVKKAAQLGTPAPDTFMNAVDRMEQTERSRRNRMETRRNEGRLTNRLREYG